MLITNNDTRGVNTMVSRPSITMMFICSIWLITIPTIVKTRPMSTPNLSTVDGTSYTMFHHVYMNTEYSSLIDA